METGSPLESEGDLGDGMNCWVIIWDGDGNPKAPPGGGGCVHRRSPKTHFRAQGVALLLDVFTVSPSCWSFSLFSFHLFACNVLTTLSVEVFQQSLRTKDSIY